MKVRLLAVMAVVVVGVMAGTSPAMAKKAHIASAWSHQHADNKKFGEAIYNLRKTTDLTNYSVAQITAASVKALTALKDGLEAVAGATTNFKYGVVQVGTTTKGLGGVGPTHFFATPPIYKTGEQSTVTFNVPQTASLGLGSNLKLLTAVRSVNPNSGTVQCRMTSTPNDVANGLGSATWRQGSTDGLFVTIPQSRITPENGNTTFPYSLVPTEDYVIDLADPQYAASLVDIATFAAAGTPAPTPARPSTLGGISVTLSCLVS